ncbi:uncharacterized protein LOC123559460 isoform X2 [Mercenaria mercenaria]|uniref:uncharacterized protein LOC123559460 isoform X2 n=1 Tax=Mercenaria mercenaria TaxID=6596 RepID=UPI00234EDFA1|nr:uncharacterized protein LOC123559460 isoform X2 [Mercenaria mercenaria]
MILSQTSKIGSPGQCFSACGFGSFIGISENECICLKEGHTLNSLRSNYTECTADCDHQPGVACGGLTENGTRFISVYNLNPNVTIHANNSETEMSCLQLEPIKQQFSWKNCSTDLVVVCGFGDEYVKTSSDGENRTWIRNANKCFSHGGFPIRFRNYSDAEFNSTSQTQMWTNVIRSSVISSEKQSIKLKALGDVRMRYGFVRKQNEYLLLDFAKNNFERKRVVCDSDEDQDKSQENQSRSSYIIVPVGVSSAVVLVTAAVVIFFVVHRQRGTAIALCRRKNVTKSSDHYHSYSQTFEPSGRLETDNHAYESIDEIVRHKESEQNAANQTSNSNYIHNYFVLEKREKESKVSAYDTIRSDQEISAAKGTNVYNRLNSDKTYDHVFTAKRNVMNTCDNPYNTTEKAAVRHSCKSISDKQADGNGMKDEDTLNCTESESKNTLAVPVVIQGDLLPE